MATPQATVSAQHLLACRANYIRNVVPSFPATRAFERHFCDSYLLVNSLSKESGDQLPVGFGLLSFGVKCHELLPASFYGLLQRHADRLKTLGLAFHIKEPGTVEAFNPETLMPQLASILGKRIRNWGAMNAGLTEFARLNLAKPLAYPYARLGWPSLVAPDNIFVINQIDTCTGMMQFPSEQDGFLKTAPLVAAAVAVVEQVMGRLKSIPEMLKTRFLTENTVAQPACEMWA
ncbi:MAG: hypothetical protein PHV13_02390 [Candidatus ainarchaeum sp.]|nr:hypothetical protein [Candidatus ainarchaeum sp.]